MQILAAKDLFLLVQPVSEYQSHANCKWWVGGLLSVYL